MTSEETVDSLLEKTIGDKQTITFDRKRLADLIGIAYMMGENAGKFANRE